MCTEAEHLAEIYNDWDAEYDVEYIAKREYERLHTLTTLAGIDVNSNKCRLNKKDKSLYLIIQDSRKDNTTLMLVDRICTKWLCTFQ